MVGNGCGIEQGSGRLDALFYFFTYFSVRVFFFAYERAYGVCKIKGDIGFLFLKTNVLLAVLQICGDVIRLKVLCSVLINSISLGMF